MNKFKKSGYLLIAYLLAFSTGSYLFIGHAIAAGVLTTRSIKISSSNPGQTKVQYVVKFTPGTSTNIGGVVIDFCQQDPIPGDTCGSITGFTTSFGTNLTTGTLTGASGFTLDASSTSTTLMMTNATPQAFSTGTPITITFGDGSTTGLTNPTTANSTYYARILTFSTQAAARAYTSTVPGTYVDSGGIAMSTTSQLSITAKVEEQLSLCIYDGANCAAGVTGPVVLGTNGVLDASNAYTNVSGKFQASTNASQGMTIYEYGTTLTATSTGYTIAAIGASAAASNPGSEQFGLCVATSGGSVTATAPYNNANCSSVTTGANQAGTAQFAFDSAAMSTLGGDQIAGSTSPSATTTGTLAYLANIAPTTKAGSYSTTQTFIGVGTF